MGIDHHPRRPAGLLLSPGAFPGPARAERPAPGWLRAEPRGYNGAPEDRAKPLRDHFRPPLHNIASWQELHGQWPAVIVIDLNRGLPPRYVAGPRVQLGAFYETDRSAYEKNEPDSFAPTIGAGGGGVATATWAPRRPSFDVVTDLPDQDAYEVRVYDMDRRRRLVAAIEVVSPRNKDRPESRRAFTAKCAALL